MTTLKTKAESKKPIYEIEVNDVFYLYAVGLQWIAISTKPSDQWGELPEWCRVCIPLETPSDSNFLEYPNGAIVRSFIHRAIKDKIHEQRKAYESQTGTNKPLAIHPNEPGQKTALSNSGRKRREKIASSLFDESDNESVKR